VKRLPLILDDTAQVQRLQPQDALDPDQTRLTAQASFDKLQHNFRLLLMYLAEQGFELPDELESELEHL
jgi:hypothetical protein